MATNNITFPIYNADGTPFNGLVLHNATFDSVVMSLGDKITGDVYYKDNTLAVTMSEYIEYKRNEDSEAVRFVLVNPPTVVREGIVSDNSELRGMTKYSFVFYHPMYAVSNFPFSDVAVSSDEQKYLSNSKTFNWIGNLFDMVAKLNKNLQGTQWIVGTNIEHYEQDGVTETSMWQKAAKIPDEPLSFDKTYVSEVLKTSYETWEIPFVVDQIASTDARYAQGKRFLILFGTPSNQILDDQGQPYIFRFGQGVGLKNNSRTPKNNKIVTRIIGYGSENNIPFGYPQIPWYGDQSWDYTINNDSTNPNSYPIYKGICGGQYIKLIKHPFTRKTLMPLVYSECVFNKVSPYMPDGTLNQNFDPTIELVDYYDADGSYVNPAVEGSESVDIHQFEDIKPEFTQHSIVGISAYDGIECISISEFNSFIQSKILASSNENEKSALQNVYDNMFGMVDSISNIGGSYTFLCEYGEETEYTNGVWQSVKYTSSGVSFIYNVYNGSQPPSVDVEWDDTMDDDGNYKQSYFKMTLPQLDFDLYACASITEEMKINMRSGACIGCTFDIVVDWDDYKKNFYDSDGNFLPDGEQRDLTKYPKTNLAQVTFVVKKDLDTFGTLMPNTYQKPHSGDEFVILGISLPTTYITNAEARLDDAAKEYMRENNVHYYEYPLKFDEHFLTTNTDILSQIRNNTIVRFQYGGELPMALYVKQITVKYSGVLPTYDITLTDDVEIVLNQVGQVTDDVSRMRVQVSELQKYYSENIIQAINEKLSKVVDDVCQGRITFQQGLDSIGGAIFHDELRSPDFTSGLYAGHGWRIDQLGNAEFESVRARSFLEVVELLVNRMQAQEGDTLFTDNDQIDKVEEKTYNGTTYYKLSLKEKWDGYVTSQKVDNIIKGIINTLAAKDGNVSDVTAQQSVESDGVNKYYTSWMKVINPSSVNDTVGTNQICVILYGDASVPAGKNFKPCELMTIARWGCDADPDAQGLTPAQKADIEKRQRVFSISTTDGRIAKLRGVRTPILQDSNYGTTLGILPDFVRSWSIASRLIDNRDYLYAQGIVVGDFIKVDALGNPLTNYVDCGNWQDNTSYLHNEYNSTTLQWETSDVWHNGSYWRCKVTQPYNNVYYEPTNANGLYWEKLLTSGSSAPFYTREWYAWSNVVSTASATESPFESQEPYSGWSTSIPNQGSDAYLWKKIVTYTWNASTRTYIAGTPQYFRMSGTNGTSISVKGNVTYAYDSVSDFPSPQDTSAKAVAKTSSTIYTRTYYSQSYHWTAIGNASDGDAYTVDSGSFGGKSLANHLIMWSSEANEWIDLGQFKGESGITYYTHVVWAQSVTIVNGAITGMTGYTPVKPSGDSRYIWMGVHVDTNSADPTNKEDTYSWEWTNTKGEKGDDASEVNPNILLRTIFDDGIDKVKEAWSSDWTVTSIDAATDTIVEGRKSLRINMANGQTGDCDLFQVIFGKLKASTWYTVSFNYFATHAWNTFLHSNVESYPAYYDASAGIIIDGVMQAMSGNNGTWQWPADWTGQRHTMTFKTASDLSGIWDNSQLLFRVPQGCQLALCMPKLEIGQVATAYMANEDDLKGEKGDQGDRGKVGRFFYFAGTFNPQDDDPTHVFVVNDAQAPYFEHTENEQKRYHVFNYETNGTYTMAQMWSISSQSWNNAPWEVMTNDFKYIITEALFAQFAQFGSAIISGDWMLSKHGIIYDKNGNAHTIDTTHTWTDTSESPAVTYNADNAYTLFDANNPYSSVQGVNNFVSCYSIDMLTGEGSYGCDKVHFGKDGSGWVANKNISWNANGETTFKGSTKSPFVEIDYQSPFFWNASHDNYGTMLLNTAESRPLPTGLEYSGRRLVVVNGYWGGYKSSNSGIYLNPATGDKLFNNTVNGQDGQETTTGVYLAHGECIELLGYGDDTTFYGWIILRKIKIYSS